MFEEDKGASMENQKHDSSDKLSLDDIVVAGMANKDPLLPNDSFVNPAFSRSLPTESPASLILLTANDTQVPSTKMEKKRKHIIKRAKAMPITRTQKRARWIPGHRYMPLLILQWLWHPILGLIRSRKASNSSSHMNDHKLYHGHSQHHHVYSGYSNGRQISFGGNQGNIFME